MTTQTKAAISSPKIRVGLIVPHIFMQRDILPRVIFSPGNLALSLADKLHLDGAIVTLFTPGPVDTKALNITADLSHFNAELEIRGDSYIDLLKKHPLTFISLARQVQSELLARAFLMANNNDLDVVHVYTNEEDLALPFAALCNKPVVFTHHDPFNFLVKYKTIFPKYKHLNWLSMSYAQRRGMPLDTNWIANIYHGLETNRFKPSINTEQDYIAFMGRIIQPKGVHLAIAAVKSYNQTHGTAIKLKIAGKHYAGTQKDTYWKDQIEPFIDNTTIFYVGYLKNDEEKQVFLGGARALIVPSIFDEPFGMVMIEALACGTPIIGIGSGSIPEIIQPGKNGMIVPQGPEDVMIAGLSNAMSEIDSIDRLSCRQDFENRFTLQQMAAEHLAVYKKLATK